MLFLRSQKTLSFVFQSDPAVDQAATDWTAYAKTGDLTHVKILDGCKPSIFTLRRLTRRQYMHATSRAEIGDKLVESVAFGLRDWTDFGEDLRPSFKQSDLGERLDDATVDALFSGGGMELFGPLAGAILSMSTLGPPTGQG